MFSKVVAIEGEEMKLEFRHYRSPEGPDVFVITGLPERMYMQFDQDLLSWKFHYDVAPEMKALENLFSATICEYEQCGQPDDNYYDGYNFLT